MVRGCLGVRGGRRRRRRCPPDRQRRGCLIRDKMRRTAASGGERRRRRRRPPRTRRRRRPRTIFSPLSYYSTVDRRRSSAPRLLVHSPARSWTDDYSLPSACLFMVVRRRRGHWRMRRYMLLYKCKTITRAVHDRERGRGRVWRGRTYFVERYACRLRRCERTQIPQILPAAMSTRRVTR